MVAEIKRITQEEGFSWFHQIEFISCFVGTLQYHDDFETTGCHEYPRYPIETLVDSGGDCEDKAILLASLLNLAGYDANLLLSSNHCAVGVLGSEDMSGDYYLDKGRRYYFIEATTPAGCGIKSDEFKKGFRAFDIVEKDENPSPSE